jgi:hypothetical protein
MEYVLFYYHYISKYNVIFKNTFITKNDSINIYSRYLKLQITYIKQPNI